MNFLLCSVGRRVELIKDFKEVLDANSKIVATDNSKYAPAVYEADKYYIVPKINDEKYIEKILEICLANKIDAVTTFIDPEIEILAKNRDLFKEIGVEVLAPSLDTAKLCFDKYSMFKYLSDNNIRTVNSFQNLKDFNKSYESGLIDFPVFVKPITGSGSVGATKVNNLEDLQYLMKKDSNLFIQQYMKGIDLDADVYVDTLSHKAVSIFSKKKIETKIGGANKTISFKDEKLFEFIDEIVDLFKFNGPIDMDFFYCNGKYYLSEINPRFGGAYLHAHSCGVDFVSLIINNLKGIENNKDIGNYEEGVVMMMFDSVVIKKIK
jgi:carbamoyl-phosphate synthase large subunit